VIALIIGTFIIGIAPLLVRYCDSAPSLIGFYRCGIAALILLIFGFLRKHKLPKDRRFYLITFLAGFFFACDLFVWHRSVYLIGPGLSTILGNTQVFYLLLFGFVLYQEKITLKLVGLFLEAFLGILLILNGQVSFFEREIFFRGAALGLLTGLFYALYTSTIKRANTHIKDTTPFQIITFVSLFTALWSYLFSMVELEGYNRSFTDNWIPLLTLAILCQIGGWGLISTGLKKVPLAISGLVLLIQPFTAKTLSILIFDEPYSTAELLGSILLFSCIYLATRSKKQNKLNQLI